MHFVHQFQCFEVFLKCVFVIFKNMFFLKNFVSLYLFRLIKTDRGSLKIFKTISIDRNTASIDRNYEKKHSFEKQPSFVHKLFQALKNMNEMYEYEM